MDNVQTSTNGALNGGSPAVTRAAMRAAAKAERDRAATPPAPTTRRAAPKGRKKRGTGAKALATAARKLAESGGLSPTPPIPVPVPIVAGTIGGHPLAIELAATLRTAGKGWTADRAKAFIAAVTFALPGICGYQTAGALPKAA